MGTQDESTLGGGRHAFSLLRRPYTYTLLYELSRGKPKSLSEIARNRSSAALSTLSELADELGSHGAIQRRSRRGAGRTQDLVLTDYGRGLAQISARLRGWPGGSPQRQRPAGAGDELAVSTIASHAEGSAGVILRRLCRAPTLRSTLIKEMLGDPEAASCGLATVEQVTRRIRLMEEAGLIEVVDRIGRGHLYAPSALASGFAGPLAHATALELTYRPPGSRPPLACEVELTLGLAAGRLHLSRDFSAVALIKVHVNDGIPAEVTYRVESGMAVQLTGDSDCRPTTAVTIATEDLFGSLLSGRTPESTAVEGDLELASTLLEAIAATLAVPAEYR